MKDENDRLRDRLKQVESQVSVLFQLCLTCESRVK